jgi:hypothetical protein
MNDPIAQSEAFSQTEELQEEVQSLRLMLCISLVLIMVLGTCGNIFLIRQISDLRSATGNLNQPEWKAYEATEYARVARYADFWNKLSDYAKTHPELAPLMDSGNHVISQTLLNPAYAPKKK